MDVKRIKFLMDIDESIDKLAKDFPKEPIVNKLQDRFYDLANRQFIKSAYQGLHELTIDDIINKQASEFYKNFPESIKNELIEGSIEMEHQRRRDNYVEFCFAIYKQIECYVNYLLNSNNGVLFRNFLVIREQNVFRAYEHYYDYTKKQITNRTNKPYYYGFKVQNKILACYNKSQKKFYTDEEYTKEFSVQPSQLYISKLDFAVKFRVVMYFCFFNKEVEKDEFENKENLFYEIQQVRNGNHGNKISSIRQKQKDKIPLDKQEEILVKSFENRYNNYLKYQGFLADFMQKVSNSPNLNLA